MRVTFSTERLFWHALYRIGFACLTEDPSGLDPVIRAVPLTDKLIGS